MDEYSIMKIYGKKSNVLLTASYVINRWTKSFLTKCHFAALIPRYRGHEIIEKLSPKDKFDARGALAPQNRARIFFFKLRNFYM